MMLEIPISQREAPLPDKLVEMLYDQMRCILTSTEEYVGLDMLFYSIRIFNISELFDLNMLGL
jgi:hypothetical protein